MTILENFLADLDRRFTIDAAPTPDCSCLHCGTQTSGALLCADCAQEDA